MRHTHVGFVFKCVGASRPSTVEVRGPLAGEHTMWSGTALSGAEPLEPFLKYGRVLAVIVRMHLDIRCRYVHLENDINV